MDRATTWLVLLGAGAYAGAAAALGVPGAGAPLAIAALLAVLAACSAWRQGACVRSGAWAVLACSLAAASLASDVALWAAQERAPPNPARGTVITIAAAPHGWSLLLDGGRARWRLAIPRTDDRRLDAWPPGVEPGARVEVPLREDSRSGGRALAPATIRVLERAGLVGRLGTLGERIAASFRERTRERLVRGPEDATGAFLLASVAGEGHALDSATWRALRASGLAHIAVVSGFNVSLLALAAAASAAPLGGAHHPRRRIAALLAVGLLLVVLPGDPPVRRACAALLVARFGRLAGRGTPPLGALGAAVLVLVALDPRLAGSLAFGLTVAATLAIALASGRGGVRGAVAVFLAPTLATWPILVAATGRVSPWSPLANLLVVPAVFPSLAAGWIAVLLPSHAGAAIAVAVAAARASAGWILDVANELACWPRSGGLAAPSGAAWPVVHGMLLLAVLTLRRTPLAPRGRRPALAVAALALAVSTAWPLRDVRPRALAAGLDVLDVGQGQALLLETGGAEPVLVDAADDRMREGVRALLDQLRARGVTRLALLALTHADRDHAGGASEVIAALAPRALALPEGALDAPELRAAVVDATRRGIPVRVLAAGDRLALGRLRATVLHPRPGQRGDDNEHALVLRVDADWVTALLTSDADALVERDLARRGLLPHTDVVVAGHHGARTCTSAALLDRTWPFVVPISCGASNRYGHPHRELLRRIDRTGAAVVRTDRDGAIAVRALGEKRLLVMAGARVSLVLRR